jgi:hypothetical protein
MACFGARSSRAMIGRATATIALLSLLLLTLTSDLHVHPGSKSWIPSGGPLRMESSSASSPALPGRASPCLACLHSRGHSLGPCESVFEEKPVSISLNRPPNPLPPPPAPILPRTEPRAPPAC